MKLARMSLGGVALAAALFAAGPVAAQDQPGAAAEAVDGSAIPMPELAFTPDEEMQRNYFKYFYFHRAETDFDTAYADIRECDDYTRDLAARVAYNGGGGMVGGLFGSVLANAIHGSAERRMQRRIIMRTCMGFKGYATFGLRKDLWEAFNFDEGNSSPPEARRQELLMMQARVASGPRPTIGELPQ